MGCLCGPRAGAHGLVVYVPGKFGGWGAAAHRRAQRDREPPGEGADILPWASGPVPWGHFYILEGLQEFLGRFRNAPAQGDNQDNMKGGAKGKSKQGKGEGGKPSSSSTSAAKVTVTDASKGKGQGSAIQNEGELLAALEKLVMKAKRDPSNLLDDLQSLAQRASAGYGSGRAARRHRAALARQETQPEAGKDRAASKGNTKQVAPDFCRPVSGDAEGEAPWTLVTKRGMQNNDQAPVQNWIVDPLAGGVISSAQASKRISEGAPLQANIVVAHTQADVDKLVSLARAHAITDKVAVVCRFPPEGKAGTMQLPSVGPGGKRQVRSWPVVPLGDAGGPALQQKLVLKPSKFKAPDRSLETIRLQIPKVFLDDATWTVACKQPSDFAKRALGPVHSFGVWQQVQAGARDKREIVLECCARVSAESKVAILGRSGCFGVFAADLASAGPKPHVEWIPCGETLGPAYLRLASNKAAEKKSSLAFRRGGGPALGVRLLGDAVPDRVCAWRARHVPRSWTPEEVEAALQDVGFTEYSLLSPGHGQLPCLFRAKLAEDTGQPSLVIQLDKVTIDIERAASKRRMVDVETVRMRPTRDLKASSPPSLSAAPSAPTTAAGPATTPAPMAVDGQTSQRGRQTSSEKSARDRSRSDRNKIEPWCDIVDCGGAGNCFYNCVGASYAVSRDKFNWKDAQKLANTRGAL